MPFHQPLKGVGVLVADARHQRDIIRFQWFGRGHAAHAKGPL